MHYVLKFERENVCYLGCVTPTITMLRKKLLLMSHLAYCGLLRMALVQGLVKRFSYIFNLGDERSKWFILSAKSYPKFKMFWVPDIYHEVAKKLFLFECMAMKIISDSSARNTPSSVNTSEPENDFYNEFFAKSTPVLSAQNLIN
jgi:hypothetical protein